MKAISKNHDHESGQIIIFHRPRFPWNKGISLPWLPFGVRSCEVAIIWPDECNPNCVIMCYLSGALCVTVSPQNLLEVKNHSRLISQGISQQPALQPGSLHKHCFPMHMAELEQVPMHDALPEPLGAKKHLLVRGISGNVSLWELWVKGGVWNDMGRRTLIMYIYRYVHYMIYSTTPSLNTVDGRNPAPPGIFKTL